MCENEETEYLPSGNIFLHLAAHGPHVFINIIFWNAKQKMQCMWRTSVFPLASFKRTPLRLTLASDPGINPGINDGAVPAIFILLELSFSSIYYISIGTIRIRRHGRRNPQVL
jgi:hypothetical protein